MKTIEISKYYKLQIGMVENVWVALEFLRNLIPVQRYSVFPV